MVFCRLLQPRAIERRIAHPCVAIVSLSGAPLGSRRKERQKERLNRYNAKISVEANKPNLQTLLRSLYKRAHPDIIRHSNPELAEVNNASLQVLNGVLSTLKVANAYPPRLTQSIPFHVRNGEGIGQYNLRLITAGGDSRGQLTVSFAQFFREIGVLEAKDFVWDKEYFPEEEVKE